MRKLKLLKDNQKIKIGDYVDFFDSPLKISMWAKIRDGSTWIGRTVGEYKEFTTGRVARPVTPKKKVIK